MTFVLAAIAFILLSILGVLEGMHEELKIMNKSDTPLDSGVIVTYANGADTVIHPSPSHRPR